MVKQNLGNWLLCLGLIISFPSISVYFLLPKDTFCYDSYLEIFGFHIERSDFKLIIALLFISFALITIASVLIISKKLNESLSVPNFRPTKEEKHSLAERNYAIQRIEELIETDTKNSWQWAAKLKSVLYRRSKLSKGNNVSVEELSLAQIEKLESDSHLLKLNNYNLRAKSDLKTVHSIKEKMDLYRKHRGNVV